MVVLALFVLDDGYCVLFVVGEDGPVAPLPSVAHGYMCRVLLFCALRVVLVMYVSVGVSSGGIF